VAGPGAAWLVGFCPYRRLVAVAAVTSAGQLFGALVELTGDAGLAGAVGQGLACVEAHLWRRTAQGWVVEVHTLTAEDFAPRGR
jgi:hypothetical protein